MRRLWMAVLAACLALAAPAEAAELKGFGPIKFGMTKDEAWKAIDGKGEWTVLGQLRYSVPSELPDSDFIVRQNFKEDRVTDVSIDHILNGTGVQYCLTRGLYFAAVIERKYGLAPAIRHGRVELDKPTNKDATSYVIEDAYAFAFDKNAGIQIVVQHSFHPKKCVIAFRYFPSSDYVVPF